MKTIFLLFAIFISVNLVVAQEDFQIIEKNLPYNTLATGFTTNITGTNENFVVYHWQKFIEAHKGVSYLVSMREGVLELESDHVVCPFMDNQVVNIHSRFEPNSTETGVLLTIWIQMKDGTYYSSANDKDSGKNIKKWLMSFHNELMALNQVH